jgi:N-carbamoylputrescine amidase
VAQASETEPEMLIADLDFEQIRTVRDTWQFYRDRRPETYDEIVEA